METLGKWAELVDLVETLKVDATKAYVKGNVSAGTRLRKGLMQIRALAKEARAETLALVDKPTEQSL